MSRNEDGERRVSVEQRRIFRTARIAFVEIGRIAGMDPYVGALLRDWDITAHSPLTFSNWSDAGLEALMLARMPVVVGAVEGNGQLAWLANPDIVLAAQCHWPSDRRIAVVALDHRITQQTRLQAAVGGLFAANSNTLNQKLPAATLFRLWQNLISAGLNPISGIGKMGFVHATACDPRKLPAVRPPRDTTEATS